jgi:hypothetical protein
MRTLLLLVLLLGGAPAARAFDIDGVSLDDSERDVTQAFPSAYCRALEWRSDAAERRCDDGRISFAGVAARVTFYLKGDRVQAFDVRFDSHDRERVVAYLASRYGKPHSEQVETVSRHGKEDRRLYLVRWEQGPEKALLSARLGRRYAQLEVSRGDFARQIYRVK